MATSIQTCYRHSDRRAGVRCQRCERPICPSCMTQASVGFHCPECARAGRQKVYTPRTLIGRPLVTLAIIAVNAVVFVVGLGSASAGNLNELDIDGGLIGRARLNDGTLIGVAEGEWWRVVTSGFLHINIIHIGFNMFLLWQLGQMLEPALGRARFGVLYVMSLLGGSLLVLTLDPDELTVGASGAVFGLMGAAFMGLRARGIDPFSTGIGGLIVLNLMITFVLPNISVGGHVGGLVAGGIGGYLMLDVAPRIKSNGEAAMAALCVALAGLLFVASIWIADNPI